MINDENNPSIGDFDEDDSFSLENLDKYPGDLSAFIEATPSTVDDVESAKEESEDSKIGDNLMESSTNDEERDVHLESQKIDTSLEKKDESFQPNEKELNSLTDIESPLLTDTNLELSETSVQKEDIDTDEFVRQLQVDLEVSKAKKAAKSLKDKQVADSTPTVEFTSVDDLPGAEDIDISGIAAQHPSNYQQLEESNTDDISSSESELPEDTESENGGYAHMAANMPVEKAKAEEIKEQSPNIENGNSKKQKKNRKTLYLLLAASVAIFAVGFGLYSFYPQLAHMIGSNPIVDNSHTDSTNKAKQSVNHPQLQNNNVPISERVDSTKKSDTMNKLESDHKKVDLEPAKQENNHVDQDIKNVHNIEKVISDSSKSKHILPVEPNEHNSSVVASKIKVSKQSKSISTPNTSKVTSISDTKQQVYTVQVYSSPTKDDADERLIRLKTRNALNPSISEQFIRGQKWYRVRFGTFASREEAELATKQLGFSQCWIDRVR